MVFLEYSTVIQPQEVITSLITNGTFPTFEIINSASFFVSQGKLPKSTLSVDKDITVKKSLSVDVNTVSSEIIS